MGFPSWIHPVVCGSSVRAELWAPLRLGTPQSPAGAGLSKRSVLLCRSAGEENNTKCTQNEAGEEFAVNCTGVRKLKMGLAAAGSAYLTLTQRWASEIRLIERSQRYRDL